MGRKRPVYRVGETLYKNRFLLCIVQKNYGKVSTVESISYILFITSQSSLLILNHSTLAWGLPGGWLGVGWGFRGVNLSYPPANPLERPCKDSL